MDSDDRKKIKAEIETLHKLCVNRKKQNFQALKQWDQIRAHKLITHRKVANEIDEGLQTRITQSDQFMKVVMQFLSDIENQLKKHQAQVVTNPQNKLMANLVSRSILMTPSKCLTRAYNGTQNFKNAKKMRTLLEEGIRKIQLMLTESERDIMDIRTKIQLKAVQIQNQNGLTIEKCDQLVASYNKDKHVKIFQSQLDLFDIQQQFLQQSVIQTKTQQDFGELVVQLLEFVERYEKAKLQLVRQILQNYLVALEESQQTNQNIKSLLDILEKRTEDEILHAFYSSEEFISLQMMRDIRRAQSKAEFQKIDLDTIKKFLIKIIYHPFDGRNLVLKEYKTYLRVGEELQNGYLVVTVDAFLHIYQYKDQFDLLESRPQSTLKCNHNLEIRREGEMNLCLQLKKWPLGSIVKQTSKTICIIFLSEDQRQQFVEFVGKIVM